MIPFPTLRLDHNNQALIKRFAYQGTRSDIRVLPTPKSQTTRLKYTNGVMTSCVGRHYQPTLWDALKACACPRKLTLLTSSFGVKIFLNPKVGVRFWFGPTQEVPFVQCQPDNLICTYTLFSWYNLLEVFKPLFHLQLDAVHFMWLHAPLKKRWCPHHVLRLFFAGLVWNFSMASWACSMTDSFTQDASIRWYPFHFTKYSRSHPLSCLDLSTASTLNSGSLWTKSSGGLELCSWLGLEASRVTDFKRKTWNVGWTLRFSSKSNL